MFGPPSKVRSGSKDQGQRSTAGRCVCVWGGGAERSSHNTVPLADSDYRRVCIISWMSTKPKCSRLLE